MPYRTTPLVDNEIYHIYNRGTEKRVIFLDKRDFVRFTKTLKYYSYKGPKSKLSLFLKGRLIDKKLKTKIAEILCYCLMPNHFHLIVKQLEDKGIEELLTKSCLSYAKYFNTKYKRVGSLFQGPFKVVHVESNEQLMHLSRYIHLNPVAACISKNVDDYEFSSIHEFHHEDTENLSQPTEILSLFKSLEEYDNFVADRVDFLNQHSLIKSKTIDEH